MDPAGRLTHYLITDLAGVTRGRGAWDARDAPLKSSMGWVPVNQLISPFDTIPADNPYGSHGDCRIHPDAATLVDVALESGRRLRFALCDLREIDGRPSELCARGFLAAALARLEAEGLRLLAAFEHEFWLTSPAGGEPAPGFSYQRFVRHAPLCERMLQALEAAALEPETFLAEFAPDQFELTLRPAFGVAAADRAVAAREIVRAVAHDGGARASFTPVRTAGGVGSGVHIHLSLWTAEGEPALHDPAAPAGLGRAGAAFAAGIVRHMPALCAFGAPTPLSYERLQPHRWSSAYTCMGDRNREATLRICPVVSGGAPAARQFNLEYRAVDATANPYLILGALVAAGLGGLEEGLSRPPLVDVDPSGMDEGALEALGVRRLPTSLPAALEALRDDTVLRRSIPERLLEAYLLEKAGEMAAVEGLEAQALCDRYGQVF